MKKLLTFIFVFTLLTALFGCQTNVVTTNQKIIEETNAEDVSMEAYGIKGTHHFKKITAEKLIELMNIKEGEVEYNIFVGNPNDPWSKEAVKRIENAAESIEKNNNFELLILYVDSDEIEANKEIYDAYLKKTSLYTIGKYQIPAMFKLCDGYVWCYQTIKENEDFVTKETLEIKYAPLSQQTINEVIIPQAKNGGILE